MADNVAGVVEGEEADILNAGKQHTLAGGGNLDRLRAEQEVEDGDVVAGEVVDRADVLADGAEVGAHGIHVIDAAELAAIKVGLQMQDAGIVEEDMADHQDATLLRGEVGEFAALGAGLGEGLFAEHVLAGLERSLDQGVVCAGRRGDNHGVDVGGLRDLAGVGGDGHAAEEFLRGLEAGFGAITDADDLDPVHGAEIADVIRAPLAEANHANAHRGGGTAHSQSFSAGGAHCRVRSPAATGVYRTFTARDNPCRVRGGGLTWRGFPAA